MIVAALAPFAPTGLRTRAPSRLGGPVLVSVVVHAAALALAVFVSVRAARARIDQQPIHVFLQPPSGPVAPIRAPAPPAAAPSPPAPAAPPAAPIARAAPAAPPVSTPKAAPTLAEPRPRLPSPPARPVAHARPADRVVKAERTAPPAPARAAPSREQDVLRRVLDRMQPAAGPVVAAAGAPDAEAASTAAAAATEARAAAAVTFVDRVCAAVESVYEIPRGLSGSVLEAALRLRFDRSGRVLARSVEVPSFDPAFDAALLAVVDRIPAVPPPPEIADTVSARGIRVWFRSDDLARGASR